MDHAVISPGMPMFNRKLEEWSSDFDGLMIDLDDLKDPPDGPDDESLDKIAHAPDAVDVVDVVDDIGDSDI
jgi:hypothetical protein